jgi:hypothetical protein
VSDQKNGILIFSGDAPEFVSIEHCPDPGRGIRQVDSHAGLPVLKQIRTGWLCFAPGPSLAEESRTRMADSLFAQVPDGAVVSQPRLHVIHGAGRRAASMDIDILDGSAE